MKPRRASRDAKKRFTPAGWKRIRAHIRARGMTFEIFLPESLASWLRKKIRAGVYADPAEAAFLAFKDLQELDRHPKVRKELLEAMLQEAMDDPRPGIPADKVFARLRARTRLYASTPPPRPKPVPKRRLNPSKTR